MSEPQFLPYKMPEHLLARQSAMRRQWLVQAVAGGLVVACFATAGMLLPPINAIRRERQLVIDPDTIKGLPPDIALLGKLGTFRALAIDWASIRADRLKAEGKTYEALQLHRMVCDLAPRFPQVWVNAAWNMAYNISVMKYTPEERWQWVKNGIEILRDEGLVYNPKAVALYKELGWIYWHKIGDFLDDEHLNYKRALAVEMQEVLGPPPAVLSDEEYYAWFRKIVEAPRDLVALLATDAELSRLAFRLYSVRLELDGSLLAFVARHQRSAPNAVEPLENRPEADSLLTRRLELINDPKEAAALDRLLAIVRSRVLREKYKLDPDWMLDLMEKQYGPLDWRNAFAHSLYWWSYGDRATRGYENISRADAINTARNVFFALQNLITRGRMTLWPDFDDPFSSYIELTPDTRYIPYLYETYLRLGKEHFGDNPKFVEGTPGPNYMTGFVTNMRNWIELLYLEGGEENLARAENYFVWLRENNPHPDGKTQEQYLITLDEFVMGDILSQLQTYKAAGAFIRSFISRSLKQLSLGQEKPSLRSLQLARMCYDYWMADTAVDINDRRKMQPFRIILRDEMEAYMQRADIAPHAKARLWKEASLELRQLTYDHLLPYFQRLCAAQKPPWNFDAAFRIPPDMEAFREKDPDYRGLPRTEGVEQGQRERQ